MKIAACKAQALPASALLQPRFQHRHDNHPLRVHKAKHLCVVITANAQQRANLLCIRNLPQIFVPPGCLGTYLFNVHGVLIVFRGLMNGDVVSFVASDSAVKARERTIARSRGDCHGDGETDCLDNCRRLAGLVNIKQTPDQRLTRLWTLI